MALRFDDYPKLVEIVTKRKVDGETLEFLQDLATRYPHPEILEIIPKVEEFIRIRRFLPPEEEERRLSELIIEIDKIRDIVHKALLEGVEKVAKRLEKITDPEIPLYVSVETDQLKTEVMETYIEDNKDVVRSRVLLKEYDEPDITSDLTIKIDRTDPTKLRVEYHFKAGCGYPADSISISEEVKEPTEEEVRNAIPEYLEDDRWWSLAIRDEDKIGLGFIKEIYPELAKYVKYECKYEEKEEKKGRIAQKLTCEGDKLRVEVLHKYIKDQWYKGYVEHVKEYGHALYEGSSCSPPVLTKFDDKAKVEFTCVKEKLHNSLIDNYLLGGPKSAANSAYRGLYYQVMQELIHKRMDEIFNEMVKDYEKDIEELTGMECETYNAVYHYGGAAGVIDCKKTETYEIKTPEDEIKMKEAIRENVKKFLKAIENTCDIDNLHATLDLFA